MKYKCKLKSCTKRLEKEDCIIQGINTFCSKGHARSYHAEQNKKQQEKEKSKRKTARESLPMLTRKLDKIVSEYIRLRDSNKEGYGKCVSCDTILHWKEAHCCHFIGRGNKKYRWDETNLRLGCPACNTYNQQRHQQIFTLSQIETYGKEKVEEMLNDKGPHKYGKGELKNLIEYYTIKLNSERIKKSF